MWIAVLVSLFAATRCYGTVSNFTVRFFHFSRTYYCDLLHKMYNDYDTFSQLLSEEKHPIQQCANRNVSLAGATSMGQILENVAKLTETGNELVRRISILRVGIAFPLR